MPNSKPFNDSCESDPDSRSYHADGPGGRYTVWWEKILCAPGDQLPARLEDVYTADQWTAQYEPSNPGPLGVIFPLVLYRGDNFDAACAAVDADYDVRQRAQAWAELHANTDPLTEDRVRAIIREEIKAQVRVR